MANGKTKRTLNFVAAIAVGLVLSSSLGSSPSYSDLEEDSNDQIQRQLREQQPSFEWSDPKSIDLRADRLELAPHADGPAVAEIDDTKDQRGGIIAPEEPAGWDKSSIKPYTFLNALQARHAYRSEFLIVIYDPRSDEFIPHYSGRRVLVKTLWAYKYLLVSLRAMFPERFTPDSPEFAVAMGGGDYPSVKRAPCVIEQNGNQPCVGDEVGPILQFGSAYKAPIFPSMITMPMPTALHCFAKYSRGGSEEGKGSGCDDYLPRRDGKIKYGDVLGLSWDDLIPQVVWRGTDFTYLTTMLVQPYRQPYYWQDMEEQIKEQQLANEEISTKEAATNALEGVYDELLPRWKGVVWTAKAEVEAEKQTDQTNSNNDDSKVLPWCNIKFSRGRTNEEIDFTPVIESGINIFGEYMGLEDLGKYKYHIDIGGGGGTTWSGTMQKLALPGLLFHHETPMKDYYADWMVPWVHYVPVREDLKDLKKMFDWAESHPRKARRIADNASQLVRSLGSREGFEPFFDRFYREPLRRVVEAYQPLSKGETWQDVLSRPEFSDVKVTESGIRVIPGKVGIKG